MAEKMTITDAVDAFELYDLFDEILDAYETDFYARSEIETELRDLLEESDDIYEFTQDEDGEYGESLERNLKEALGLIFEEHGVEQPFDEEFMEDAMDDDEIAGLYNDDSMHDSDDADAFEDDDSLF